MSDFPPENITPEEELQKILSCSEVFMSARGKNIDNKHPDYVMYYTFYHNLSEGFIRKYTDIVDFGGQAFNPYLSEDFIREYKDHFIYEFNGIAEIRKLSFDFIKEFLPQIELDVLLENNLYSDSEKESIKELYSNYMDLL